MKRILRKTRGEIRKKGGSGSPLREDQVKVRPHRKVFERSRLGSANIVPDASGTVNCPAFSTLQNDKHEASASEPFSEAYSLARRAWIAVSSLPCLKTNSESALMNAS